MLASKLILADETYQKPKVLTAAIKPILVVPHIRAGLPDQVHHQQFSAGADFSETAPVLFYPQCFQTCNP